MLNKRCQYCNTLLEWDNHGNRDYCDEYCYNANKKLKNIEKYNENKNLKSDFEKADQILKHFYDLYGAEKLIDVRLPDGLGMNWVTCKREEKIKDIPAIVIDQYAYTLIKNDKIVIWKL
jgi:hypothetical protein